jgi:regulator of protease activity HflC (stomatin/prohibitin superfamily)
MSKLFMPFVTIEQRNVAIIERFGRYSRQMDPGLSFKIPIFE